ncbi:Tryptophan synthase alpha chain [Anaerohalosphaera lusitana]|uniref:Tryptophan synthase alpha chain n=1 Tax=Anaerohalosphaera lusitana TaxID=1936003 RepID=A0A1U9NLA7_9BACT|nr:tryptophan synthase subunit alpha [Anaerohalosphaera lusitana]AQT68587.1 Tryptophan synthase alpha chain [Anaerohalosphaera lusitana]
MTTYKQIFEKLDSAALIPFFVIGDPNYDSSLKIVKSALDAGADILELGIPFSDPIADGPTIQKANIRARKSGMTVEKALAFIKEVTSHKPVPVGLLVYYNLIYQYGVERFMADFKAAGGTSVLVADVSIDDSEEIAGPAQKAGLETVFMVTPNTPDHRMASIASKTTGFVYTVSTMGVTGARTKLSDTVASLVERIKGVSEVPVCVGFGISSPEQARRVADAGADGVIVGSRIVQIIEDNADSVEDACAGVGQFIADVKSRLNG